MDGKRLSLFGLCDLVLLEQRSLNRYPGLVLSCLATHYLTCSSRYLDVLRNFPSTVSTISPAHSLRHLTFTLPVSVCKSSTSVLNLNSSSPPSSSILYFNRTLDFEIHSQL
ncbi:uncharacterized protein LAJ45_06028 [Morchella importuna]|uniref:uncharacterized protein n=1 Tax=Morchella importuna TaxID=1174673 RepID=UPI001E8D0817|nr:uncharacterized protein LAJ45_06028 [Morchella importuna]KAH8149876.1 hypothetical protein LAJ45_06028 [Morchella importuna]